jgi:hypothetical protein
MSATDERTGVEVLDRIPVHFDLNELLGKLHVAKGSSDAKDIEQLAKKAASVARPKAVCKVSYLEERGHDTVKIDGVIFASRVLRINLDGVERVFPYVATCGGELDELLGMVDDLMARFCLDTIKDIALTASREYLSRHLKKRYAPGRMSRMNPGSGTKDLWPIEQQRHLFSIFGNVEKLIGVRLTESSLMIPNKSVSGIFFPTEITFEACQLCPREVCQGRRAPYDEKLVRSYNM